VLVSLEIYYNQPEKQPLKVSDVTSFELKNEKFTFSVVEGYDVEIPRSSIKTWSVSGFNVRKSNITSSKDMSRYQSQNVLRNMFGL